MKSIAKSIFSKICCLFSAALLIYSLVPVQAFANPTSGTDVADSKVTINGLESGDVVSAYLIADADIDAANNLTYKMADGLPSAYNTIDKIAAVATDGYTCKMLPQQLLVQLQQIQLLLPQRLVVMAPLSLLLEVATISFVLPPQVVRLAFIRIW